MKGTALEPVQKTDRKLDYRETADAIHGFFAWKPYPVSAAVVRALSRFMHPLEQGAYGGRSLSGEPHKAAWVIASPLTVFVLPEAGRRHKLFLAARLRSTGPVNIIQDPPAGRAQAKHGKSAAPGGDKKTRGRRGKGDKTGRPASGHHGSVSGGCDFDLEALIAIQKESDLALTVVPCARAHHQLTPDAPPATMGARVCRFMPMQVVRKGTNWVRTFRNGRVKNCRPVVLSKWLEANPDDDLCAQAAELRHELMSNIESERRACTGPPLPSKWEVRRRVLSDPVLAVYMQEFALRESMTREAVIVQARDYIEEIQSEYRVGVARYFVRVVDYLFDKFLTGVEVDREGIRLLAECDNRSRIVMVCDHKSYADSLLIGYTMFRSGMVPPQQAAGQNMDFWPMGWLLRHSGAFYIRRTFMGETLYKEVFCAYVRYLLAENYTSVVYIEGTRTRDGKLAKPKIGYMGILEDALRMGVCPDITLVPVYMSFDKIPDEASHVREMAGTRKASETMGFFAGFIASQRTKLGKAYVKFGTPMSFRALLDEHGLRGAAEVACDEINRITVVTGRSLAGCALLAPGTNWVSEAHYEEAVRDLLRYCERRRLPMALDADFDGVRAAVDLLVQEGYVVPAAVGGENGFRVEGYNRRFLEYNKNIQLAHFLEPALAAVAERSQAGGVADSWRCEESVRFLRHLFGEEFVFSPSRADEAWKLDYKAYSGVLCSLLDSYLEGYLVACRAIGRLEFDRPVTREEAVDLCFAEGERMLHDGSIRREESLSRIAFKNAVKC
ncbi:MAG TPA: 1-acyl-sn-glycerol-3-phosphate acyltransferase, partial [Candidatus Anoxymicrobiaceae bacterium]